MLEGDHSLSHASGCLLGHLGYISIHFCLVKSRWFFLVAVLLFFFLRRDLLTFPADFVESKPTIWHRELDSICDCSDQNRYVDVLLTVTKCLNLSRAYAQHCVKRDTENLVSTVCNMQF